MKTGTAADLPAPAEVQAAVAEFVQIVGQRTHEAGRIVVYGSAARGEYGPASDVDILVEWNGDVHEAWGFLALVGEELLAKHKVMITAFPVALPQRQALAQAGGQFWRQVEADGVVVT